MAPKPVQRILGTPDYLAPEVLLREGHGKDIPPSSHLTIQERVVQKPKHRYPLYSELFLQTSKIVRLSVWPSSVCEVKVWFYQIRVPYPQVEKSLSIE